MLILKHFTPFLCYLCIIAIKNKLLMEIKKVKLSALRLNPNNPRLIKDFKFQKLVKSILTFPKMLELREIVTDETMMVLGGNMRLRALQHIAKKAAAEKAAATHWQLSDKERDIIKKLSQ